MKAFFDGFSTVKKWIVGISVVMIVLSMSLNIFLAYRLLNRPTVDIDLEAPALARLDELSASLNNDLYKDLIPQLGEYVTTYGNLTDTWSMAVIDTETGDMASWNSHTMCSASIIKQFIMGAVFENYDNIIQEYDEATIQAWLKGMITRSDNDCANALISVCGFGDNEKGIAYINAFCKKYGYTQTVLDHPFYTGEPTDKDNVTSAVDNASYQFDILKGRFEHSEEMLNLLKGQQFTHKIPAGLPGRVQTANKTGDLDTVENDCAIVWADTGTYIFCVVSEGLVNATAARSVIRGLSSIVYSYFMSLDRNPEEETVEENVQVQENQSQQSDESESQSETDSDASSTTDA